MRNFGMRLKKLRENKGLTLAQLGEIADCHYFMLRDWEKGRMVLTIGILIKLSQYFEVSIDYLVGL
ncbi:MAG: helix-turn-helix transcriptional regulator [Clostridia bacterium]|nr:helix-turn-helix transcriptional regulator [Clostridia bacterium]